MIIGQWWVIVVVIHFASHTLGQDLNIYGVFNTYTADIDDREIDAVYGSCFRGMDLVTCSPKLVDDDFALSYDLDYYKSLAGITGQYYCLKCCGSSPDHMDTWDMYCGVSDAINNGVNLFGYELRLARKAHSGDRGVITCPLRRSACTYDENGKTIECRPFEVFTYLTGYKLTIWVNQYNQNFKYWKGVTKCEIQAIESNFSLVAPEMFRETITLIHEPINSVQWDNFKVLIVLVFVVVLVYGILYFTRKARCMYCQQKLVFCTRLCYKCRIVGAELPDPDLIKALEEKGQTIQGEPPDNVFSPVTIVEFFRERVMGVICCGFYYLCYCCCFFGGRNNVKKLTKAVSQTIKVQPVTKMPPRIGDYEMNARKPGTAQTVMMDEEKGLDHTVSFKKSFKKKKRGIDSSNVKDPIFMARGEENKQKTVSVDQNISSNLVSSFVKSLPQESEEKKIINSNPPNSPTKSSISLPFSSSSPKKNKPPTSPIDPKVAKKRQWWEKLLRSKVNPNLLPYDKHMIQVAVRHPTEPDTAEAIIQHVRSKQLEDKLLYQSVYHSYDPRAVLHSSIVNTHEDNGPIRAAAIQGKSV